MICGSQQIFWASNRGLRDEWDEDALGDKRHFIQFFGGKSEGESQLEDLGLRLAIILHGYGLGLD